MRVDIERKPSNFKDMDSPETAAIYNRIMSKNFFFMFIARRVVDYAGSNGKVLDVGCGPGQLLIALGKRASNLELHGLDLSPNMLEIAKRNLNKRLPGRQVTLHQGSMYEIPLPDDSFDLVVNSSVIHMTDTLVPLINEINRVLKSDGKAVIVGFRRDQPRWVWNIGRMHSRWTKRLKQPLDGFAPVLESSYTAEELEENLNQSTVRNYTVTNGRYFLFAQLNEG